MSEFVLIHGAWHGGWCWERVATLLRAAGHTVLTPTLCGLAERRSELTPEVGLEQHVQDTLAALETAQGPAVLVGHSYSGLVVAEAAAREPARVAELVLLDAWIGPPGSSLLSLAPTWFRDGILAAAESAGDGWLIPAPDPQVVGVSDERDGRWLRDRLTPQPLKTFTDPIERAFAVPARAVLGEPGPVSFADLAGAMGLATSELEGGHDLMVTAPAALATTLMEAP